MASASTTVPAELLAKLGATVAATAERLQARWQPLPPEAAEAIDRLDALGLQVQALARVLCGEGAPAPEAVDLGMAVLQARAAWHGELQRRGVVWTGPQQGWVVQGSPGVLMQLLDLAIRHAAQLGRRIDAALVPHAQPGHAALRLTIPAEADPVFALAPEPDDGLQWDLLALLAHHTGVLAERHVQAHAVVLTLGFPTSMDPGRRPPSADTTAPPTPPSRPAAAPLSAAGAPGRPPAQAVAPPPRVPDPTGPATIRILLLEPHEPTRREAVALLAAAGMVAAAVPTVAQARAALVDARPACVITGISVGDPSVAPLLTDLRARRPTLRVLELADGQASGRVPSPDGDAPLRIARADLARELVPALTMALRDG